MTSDTQRSELDEKLIRAGNLMANILFNLDQRGGLRIDEHRCIKYTREEWDEALSAWNRRTPPKVGSGELDAAEVRAMLERARDWMADNIREADIEGATALGNLALYLNNSAISETIDDVAAIARFIWSQLCPGIVMRDEDLPHYENAARAAIDALAAPVDHPEVVGEDWQTLETAPHACHVLATRFDEDCGEWVVAVVLSPPSAPFTRWRLLPPAPALHPSDSPAHEAGVADPTVYANLLEFYRTSQAIKAAEQDYYERSQGLDDGWEITQRGGFKELEAESRRIDDLTLRLIELGRALSIPAKEPGK